MQPERLTSLYREFGPSIYARCRSLLGDERAAEDATQETFIRVLRHLDRLPQITLLRRDDRLTATGLPTAWLGLPRSF